jgi:hypothetical protein
MRNENYITFEEIPANLKKNSNDIIYQYKRYLSIINEPIKYNEKKEILFNLILLENVLKKKLDFNIFLSKKEFSK